MSKSKKNSPAPKKSPSTKPAGAASAAAVELVSLSSVSVLPSGRRTSRFDAPAEALVKAHQAGKQGAAFAYTVNEGIDPKTRRSYLYCALQKSLKKVSDKEWAVKLALGTDGKTIYASIAPR